MRRWLLVFLLLCAPLPSALAHGAHGLGSLVAEAAEAAVSQEAPGPAEFTPVASSPDGEPCHAHGVAPQAPALAVHARRGPPPSAIPWRPSKGRITRPERPNWPTARHGAPRLPA